MAKLRAEIGQKGLCEPIIVRSRDDGYEIVDGEHRWQICRDLGWEEIPCIVQEYSDTEAKLKTLQLNYMRGSVLPIKLAHLIHDLNKETTLEDLAKHLPYEEPQLQDSLELLKLPEGYGKELVTKAQDEEKELPSVISFVVYQKQLELVDNAISIASKLLPEGTKNAKAHALSQICSYFIDNNKVEDKSDAETESE